MQKLFLTTIRTLVKPRDFIDRINRVATRGKYVPGMVRKWAEMAQEASSDSHVWIKGATKMNNLLKRFVKDESGATAIEYGLIAAGISVAIIATVQGLGGKLNSTFTAVTGALK